MNEVKKLLEKEEVERLKKEFDEWSQAIASIDDEYESRVNKDMREARFKSDIELQPKRWMTKGIGLIQSAKGTSPVRFADGVIGRPMDTILEYPVFQLGSEFFLKGMYLCQYDECRTLASNEYLDQGLRSTHKETLKNLGHDLFKIIDKIKKIPEYKNDEKSLEFLKMIKNVIRYHYYPLYLEERKGDRWAQSRYPIRFYDDDKQEGKAQSLFSYPKQWMILKLFEPTESHVDNLWGITKGLSR